MRRYASETMAFMPESPRSMVVEFHRHVGAKIADRPQLGDSADLVRCDFIEEEARELREAVTPRATWSMWRMLWLTWHTSFTALQCTFGIDIDAAIVEVHRSNMTKSPAGSGKAVKGSSYSPPNLNGIVRLV